MSRHSSFPEDDYTPFGYLDNPHHSAVLNRSGVVRSVPPLGMGFWVRDLPWPYGNGFGHRRIPGYLSLMHLAVRIDDVLLQNEEDFAARRVALSSRYHSKLVMSYDFACSEVHICARYVLDGEDTLICLLEAKNASESSRVLTVSAMNVYGFPGATYWGCDGLVADYHADRDAGISKVWAYGDVMALGADRQSSSHGVYPSESAWSRAVRGGNLSGEDHVETRFAEGGDHVCNGLQYRLEVAPGDTGDLVLALARGKNEIQAGDRLAGGPRAAPELLRAKRQEDTRFYETTPLLDGDWPAHWKHGWVYDLETLRMNIRPPIGIYTHAWDAMQVHTPRVVLGEASLDSLCLSYADPALAKEVLLGTFADAPMPNVPCSREDGSMNMISANGKECGTAPIWGLPFQVIKSIYLRDGDDAWLRQLYPHLKAFLQWWLEHRTDENGWFHATCSWESGQDGSKRFLIDSHDPGAAAEFVRTVDIEAAMAHAMKNMAFFAGVVGEVDDAATWRERADQRIEHTRSMFVDGWYRDVDARNNQPIFLKNIEAFGKMHEDYYDIMMLTPVALGIATPEQLEGIIPKLEHFKRHRKFWLEWPSFWQVFSEAAWHAGQRELLSNLIADVAERTYSRIDRHERLPVREFDTGLPPQYNYRIPGVAMEFWPIDETNPGGCENYGWGATLPALIIRNIFGFREVEGAEEERFLLAPTLPRSLCTPDRVYGVQNLGYRQCRFGVCCRVLQDDQLEITLTCRPRGPMSIEVTDDAGRRMGRFEGSDPGGAIRLTARNGTVYTVTVR